MKKINTYYFVILLISVILISLSFDVFVRNYSVNDYFLYYTHLSVIFVCLYLLIKLIIKRSHLFISLALPAILTTGVLYMTFMFWPLLITYISWMINPNASWWFIESYKYLGINVYLYCLSSILLTLFLHLIIPAISYQVLKEDFKQRSTFALSLSVNLVWFIIYFVIVESAIYFPLDGIAGINLKAPYPFLNFVHKSIAGIILNFTACFGIIIINGIIISNLLERIFKSSIIKNSN